MLQHVWKHQDWPNFTHTKDKFSHLEREFSIASSSLAGQVSMLSDSAQYDTLIELMMSEAISTSSIEGEKLDRESVRSSLKNYLGVSTPHKRIADPRVENITMLMVQVRKHIHSPLSQSLLSNWHEIIMEQPAFQKPLAIGRYRDAEEPMVIASGPVGFEKIHYQAPPAHTLPSQMDKFYVWYNADSSTIDSSLTPLVKTSIAHLWFECLHPFDDGNGRIGRAIAEHCIGQSLGFPPLLSLSSTIEKRKNDYYDNLQRASFGDVNLDDWIAYFATTIVTAQKEASQKVSHILDKSRFWIVHANKDINARQEKVLMKMFDAGPDGFTSGMNASKYQSISKCSKATATRDLSDLLQKSMISQLPGSGRNTRYTIELPKSAIETTFSENNVAI